MELIIFGKSHITLRLAGFSINRALKNALIGPFQIDDLFPDGAVGGGKENEVPF